MEFTDWKEMDDWHTNTYASTGQKILGDDKDYNKDTTQMSSQSCAPITPQAILEHFPCPEKEILHFLAIIPSISSVPPAPNKH